MVLGVTLRQLHPVSGRCRLRDWEHGRTVWQETKLFRRFRLATTCRIVHGWSRSVSSTTRRLFQRTFSDSCWLRRERSRTAQDADPIRTTEAHTRKDCMQRCSSSALATALGVQGTSEAATLHVSQSRPLFLSVYMWMFLRGNSERARTLPGFTCLC